MGKRHYKKIVTVVRNATPEQKSAVVTAFATFVGKALRLRALPYLALTTAAGIAATLYFTKGQVPSRT